MSAYREWRFYGRNKDGSCLSSKQIEALIALDEFDLEDLSWDEDDIFFGSGCTESLYAYEHVENDLDTWAGLYPDAMLTVFVQNDGDGQPGGFFVRDGKVKTFTSSLVYFDDEDGHEFNPLEGVTQ